MTRSATTATDMALLGRWRAGDRDAGNELFQRHFSSICRFFETKIQGDVEELVQATFLACVSTRDRFREQCSFRTYLFSIARYQLYRHYRDNNGGKVLDFEVTSVADLTSSARGKLARNQEHELLLQALCTLPLEQQILLELFYWEGMESPELAEVFDVAPSTIRARLAKARQVLRDRLAQLTENPSVMDRDVDSFDSWARVVRDKTPDHT